MPSSDDNTTTIAVGKALQPVKKEITEGSHTDRILADRYHIKKTIGSGGMGEIYLAVDSKLQRKVAIKMMLNPEEGSDNKRFELESQTVAGFSDPHTIRLFDYGVTDEGYQYQVIEYLDGCNVKEYLKKNGPLKPSIAKTVGIQLCGSLAEAHRMNILHRDIKPSNIMLIETPERGVHAKLLDFGLARADNHDPTITKTGMVLGSPMYMSPEQIDKKSDELTPLTDVYSLGLTLYTIVTGKAPYVGGSLSSILASQLFHAPTSLLEVRPELVAEPALCWTIETAIEKNPDKRFTSVGQMKKALAMALKNPNSSLYLQNRDLYCDDECIQDYTSPSFEAISLTSNFSISGASSDENSVETINQKKPSNLAPVSMNNPSSGSSSKTSLALAGLLLICVAAFIWSQVTSSSPQVSTTPTPTKVVSHTPAQKQEAPTMVGIEIVTTPSDAAVLLNGVEAGRTPTTLEVSKEATGDITVRKPGYQDYTVSLPVDSEMLNLVLKANPSKPKVKKNVPSLKTTGKDKKTKKSTKTSSESVKKLENPFGK